MSLLRLTASIAILILCSEKSTTLAFVAPASTTSTLTSRGLGLADYVCIKKKPARSTTLAFVAPVSTMARGLVWTTTRRRTLSLPPLQSSIVQDKNNEDKPSNPFSYFRLALFTLTVCGNWFAEPVQSLVDTIVVGRVSTLQLAALGPATIVFDAAVFLCYFLAIATTNLLAVAIANSDESEQRSIVSQSLGVALLLGLVIVGVIFGFGSSIMGGLVGGANLNLVADAMAYSKIRVLVAPAAIVGLVCQASCLAYLDTFTPAIAVITATCVNLLGDYLLCIVGNFGIRGAAVATALAQLLSCSILLKKTRQSFLGLDDDSPSSQKKNHSAFISLPDRAAFMRLFKLGGPIFFVICGELACQFVITMRATTCGIMSLASHNIIFRIYLFFATFGDGLSHTAQAFLPRIRYNNNDNDTNNSTSVFGGSDDSAKTLYFRLSVLGGALALMCSTMTCVLASVKGTFFTFDPAILNIMKTTSPWLGAIFLLQPFNLLFEGIAIAKRDFKFLMVMYAASIAFLVAQMRFCTSLAGVWRGLFGFQMFRLIQFIVRSRRTQSAKL
jgi:putative MATE family efflux protein